MRTSKTKRQNRYACSPTDACWPHLPARVRAFAIGMFTQQCWLWGCDARRAEGNVLMAYGCARHPAPAGCTGVSAYRYDLGAERAVVLWPFGMFFGNTATEGVYVDRYTFAPVLLPALDAKALPHMPQQLPALHTPHTQQACRQTADLLQEALHWLAAYETWVVTTLGLDYRHRCVDAWKRGPFRLGAERIVPTWYELAAQCATHHSCYHIPNAGTELVAA